MKQWATLAVAVALSLIPMMHVSHAQGSSGQDASDAKDRITAGFISEQLRVMGYSGKIDSDTSGDPRVHTKVDGYDWSLYFYNCDKNGKVEERHCASYQFYSGYTMPQGVPLATINKWNTEKRYAKAYTYLQKNGGKNTRIEIDVLVEGTRADQKQTFQSYFEKMKTSAATFREFIGFRK